MKAHAGMIAILALAGCSTEFLEKHSTGFSEHSKKSPAQYVQCLEPQWQAPGTSASKIETKTGYTLEVSGTHIGPIALAVINAEATGSQVDVYLPTAQGRAERWEDAAKECL
ncbi:hypothetical protein ACIUV2_25305 [Pseudomonas aeruginosa]|nr:hypothetical protein [Pseudomonas aeruginosa]